MFALYQPEILQKRTAKLTKTIAMSMFDSPRLHPLISSEGVVFSSFLRVKLNIQAFFISYQRIMIY
jgi:hypothetical protein